jgi:hypothetical protein
MAKPRVFVSSTFFDLRQVRTDIDRFIKELGYEAVLNELGGIPYGKDDKLEEYCYKEISSIDILVSIIGGRFGTESQHQSLSISQMEFKTAFDLNKQVYIFIEKNVYAEYQTFLLNKQNKEIKYRFADNIKIYEFIELLESLPNNNNISSFETSNDIVQYLKDQWAGLFQRFLSEQTRLKEINLLKGVENTAKTLNQLVNFLTEERKDRDQAIKDILLSNHPAMEQLRELLKVNYRVYFTTKDELTEWLSARQFKLSEYDEIFGNDEHLHYYFTNTRTHKKYTLAVKNEIFNDDGKLKPYTKSDWKEEFIGFTEEDIKTNPRDDLPF